MDSYSNLNLFRWDQESVKNEKHKCWLDTCKDRTWHRTKRFFICKDFLQVSQLKLVCRFNYKYLKRLISNKLKIMLSGFEATFFQPLQITNTIKMKQNISKKCFPHLKRCCWNCDKNLCRSFLFSNFWSLIQVYSNE
jgi:hypothetical protein